MAGHPHIDSAATVGSAIVLGTVGVLSFIVQPGLVQGFVATLGLDEATANDLAFWEMAGIALATVAVALVSAVANWRHLLAGGLLLATVGNLLSAAMDGVGALQVARFVTGLGEGVVVSLSFTVVGLTARVERNLSLYLVLLLGYGAVGLWAMPRALDLVGLSGIFVFWAVVTALAALTIRQIPTGSWAKVDTHPHARQMGRGVQLCALAGFLLYNTAIGLAWANLFLVGMDIRPDDQAIANALLLSQFVAIGGAVAAVYLAERVGKAVPIGVGILGGAGAMALLAAGTGYTGFVVAVCVFNLLWNFALPFILGSIGLLDTRGRLMAPAVAMQMIGLGFGPFLAARILGAEAGFKAVELATMGLLLTSLAILTVPLLLHRRAMAATEAVP